MKVLNFIAFVLIVIGALNWGLWGFFQFDFFAWIFEGNTSILSRICYAIIGLGGVWSLGFFGRCHDICGCKKGSGGSGCCSK